MTFFERLRVHRGGLVLDAVEGRKRRRSHVEACGGGTAKGGDTDCIAEVYAEVLLFIDGAPRWIRLEENDLEIL